jgi:predicted RNase H-like nuclease (RuvC/YqgF family)
MQARGASATQQTTKNKLKRYVIDPSSIEEQLERLRRDKEEREHPQVFDTVLEPAAERRNHDYISDDATVVSPRQHDDINMPNMSPSFPAPSPSWHPGLDTAAELRGELRVYKEQARKDAERIEKLQEDNGNLRISLGQYKGKSEELEKQVLQLSAPKGTEPNPLATTTQTPTHDDNTAASTPTSWWRRTFG